MRFIGRPPSTISRGQAVVLAVGAAHVEAGDEHGEHDHAKPDRDAERGHAVADRLGQELLVEGDQADVAVIDDQHERGEHPAEAASACAQFVVLGVGLDPGHHGVDRVGHAGSPVGVGWRAFPRSVTRRCRVSKRTVDQVGMDRWRRNRSSDASIRPDDVNRIPHRPAPSATPPAAMQQEGCGTLAHRAARAARDLQWSDEMSDLYPVDPAFGATIDGDAYERMCAAALADPDAFWRDDAAAPRLDRAPTRIKDVSFDRDDFHIRWFADGELNASVNCLDRHLADARRQDRDHLGSRRSGDAVAAHHLPRAARARLPARQRAAQPRRAQGRPRHDLPADDPRGGGRDARLRAHRRGALGGVRRLRAGVDRRPHRRLRAASWSSPPTKACAAARRIPLKANVDAALKRRAPTRVETVLVVRHTGGAVAMQMPRDRWYDAVVDGQPDTLRARAR